MAPEVYRWLGEETEYTRQAGFEPLQQEAMVRNYARQHGKVRAADVMDLCRMTRHQAWRLLQRLVEGGVLVSSGEGRGRHYRPVDMGE